MTITVSTLTEEQFYTTEYRAPSPIPLICPFLPKQIIAIIFCFVLSSVVCKADESKDYDINKWDFSLNQKKRCSVSNQVENNICIQREYKASDAELNRLYKLLINDLVNSKPLKESQLSWIRFRDKACIYELSGLGEDGSLPFYQKTACLIDLTEKRILDLKVYFTWTYDGSPPRKH